MGGPAWRPRCDKGVGAPPGRSKQRPYKRPVRGAGGLSFRASSAAFALRERNPEVIRAAATNIGARIGRSGGP